LKRPGAAKAKQLTEDAKDAAAEPQDEEDDEAVEVTKVWCLSFRSC